MCGIAGILKFNETVQLSSVKAMTDAIAHRGPDGEGQWIDATQKVGLGHRRLSIIDLSDAASQPMHSACGNYTLVFNGEIYNYIELREALIADGEQFTTDSDTEVLLKLYIKYGANCLDELDGMWAFAIWDEKKQELFCARDRFGEKPFHYVHDESGFYFASEMKALWAAGIPKLKDDEMFESFAKSGQITNPADINQTFYQNIKRLQHSHYMMVDVNGNLKTTCYYELDWKNKSFKGSFEEAKEEFKTLFLKSLSNRLRSDVPVGTSLSGGMDSSTIVCAIDHYFKNRKLEINSFSARFEGFKKDEGYYIHQVVEKTGIQSFETWPTGADLFKDFKNLCEAQEEPFGSASIYAQYRVQQLAKENNVTVLIDGQGADEFLAGYIYYYSIYLKQLQLKRTGIVNRIKEQRIFIDFHLPHKDLIKFAVKNTFFYEFKNRVFVKKKRSLAEVNLSKALFDSMMCGGLQELLRYADRNSMAHSREVRLPFLNKDLIEFCFSLPDEFKLKLGWTKYILRCTFEDILPPEVCWRKEKVGFEPPQKEWLANFKSSDWKELMKNAF